MDEKMRMPIPQDGQAPRGIIHTHQATSAKSDVNKVDLAEAARFLDLLAPGGSATFQTFDDSQRKRSDLISVYHGTLEEYGERLVALNKEGAGVFICVNATDGLGRKANNVTAVCGVFADFDDPAVDPKHQLAALPEDFQPTITVESSPGKYHAYWLTWAAGELALDEFKPLQQSLARLLSSDTHVCDLPRVMRLPGFIHRKGEPFTTRVLDEGKRLSGDAIRDFLQPHLAQIESVTDAPVQLRSSVAHPYALRAIERAVYTCTTAPQGERNHTLNREAYGVFGLVKGGLLEEQEARDALLRAGKGASLPLNEIRDTLNSAWKAAEARGFPDNDPQSDLADGAVQCEERMERVESALAKAKEDPGALFERHVLTDIMAIRQGRPADWQRVRAAAKAAKVQIGELDKLTSNQASEEGNALFPLVEPWPDSVDGAALVRELSDTLRQYVVCEPETADAAALWITFTWFIEEVHVAPIANITAPLPNCGKSTLLEYIEMYAFQPLKCDGISAAALFRSMDKWRPTLLVDEVDSFLRDNEDARGVLNSGHRRNGQIVRVVGDDYEPTPFSTWGAKALCGIGSLASTLASRSIRMELRRKRPQDTVANLRFMPPELRDRLRRQLARLHEDLALTVAAARPAPVPSLSNRAADNWEPLQQVAEAIGGEWPERVNRIAKAITQVDDEEQVSDIGTELLKDVRGVFQKREHDRIFTGDLLEELCADQEAPWITWNRGKRITDRQLSKKLGDFGIKSKTIRAGNEIKKGYKLADFRDAFVRYLPPTPAFSSVTPLQPSNYTAFSVGPPVTGNSGVTGTGSRELSNHVGCNVATDTFASLQEDQVERCTIGLNNPDRCFLEHSGQVAHPGEGPEDDDWLN
ncbi:MAG: DUF3631 domain-containing protein [Pseudomonadota bacterium]